MRKDFGSKPMLYPMPVLIIGTYGEDGTPNAMNAAWGGIVDTNLIGICLADHKTTRNIFARKAFTVSMADAENMVAADYVGIVSGDKVPDKVARAGWRTSKSHLVDAPIIDELPMTLEWFLRQLRRGHRTAHWPDRKRQRRGIHSHRRQD